VAKRRPANRKHFTEDNVLRLVPKRDRQYLIWDAGTGAARGLAILVSPKGAASYRAVYFFKGSSRPHWLHLGRVGEMTLETARNRCRAIRGQAKEGIDPGNDPATADSFKAAIESYIAHEQKGARRNVSADATQALMLHHCAAWCSRPVASIRYGEIESLLWAIRDGPNGLKARPYVANRLYSHLRDFFGWCARRHTIKSNPMADMRPPFDKMKERDRPWFKKTAADAAIKRLWEAADKIGGNEGSYLRVMLLTGKRKTALLRMRWQEIEPDGFWDAPKSESKNKRLHGIPLSRLAQAQLPPRQSHGLVFGDINLNRLQRKVRKESGIKDFFWHGLRHLCETKTAELRDGDERPLIPPHLRDRMFDHAVERGAGKSYDHHDYKPEMRAAMEAWADHVATLVGEAPESAPKRTTKVPFESPAAKQSGIRAP
jgi:integrase